jgi:nucleoside-triphosphatase THEP1
VIAITVTGGRGEGKTTTAILIVKALREAGFAVTYQGATTFGTETVREIIDTVPAHSIIAGCTPEIEYVVIDKT